MRDRRDLCLGTLAAQGLHRLSAAPGILGQGIATAVAQLLREYLFRTVCLHTVTAHVMTANRASAAVLIKAGFPERYSNVVEDWGLDVPVLVDKYVLKEAEDLAEETGIRIEKTD